MTSIEPVYATKADFDEAGLAPHLQSSTKADRCIICLKDIACETLGAAHKPLSRAERKFLDEEYDTNYDISYIHHDRHHHHHHHQEEQVGARLKPCGHVFGKTCIEEWLKDHNTCPLCRIELFPRYEKPINWDEVPGHGSNPWLANGGTFW